MEPGPIGTRLGHGWNDDGGGSTDFGAAAGPPKVHSLRFANIGNGIVFKWPGFDAATVYRILCYCFDRICCCSGVTSLVGQPSSAQPIGRVVGCRWFHDGADGRHWLNLVRGSLGYLCHRYTAYLEPCFDSQINPAEYQRDALSPGILLCGDWLGCILARVDTEPRPSGAGHGSRQVELVGNGGVGLIKERMYSNFFHLFW
mmetsp:Transcript_15369/g.31863  ORF Transcript_15369/g.31863 Transcript_15369/m.31863 type:complete len:201 (-) Transcript_15369:52-654(-)